MKQFQRSVCVLLSLLCFCVAALPISAEESGYARVTVLGNASVEAPADSAVIRFELSSYSRTVERARADNDARLLRVREALQAYGAVSEEGFYTRESFSGVRFCVTRCLSLTTERVDEMEAILSCLHTLGVDAISETAYFCKDTASYEAEALKLAVADAKMRASVLGCEGEPSEIHDLGCFCCPYVMQNATQCTPTVRVETSVEICFFSSGAQ
jgi:uncharacterized protein YggE